MLVKPVDVIPRLDELVDDDPTIALTSSSNESATSAMSRGGAVAPEYGMRACPHTRSSVVAAYG